MIEKLKELKVKFEDLTQKLSNPEVIADTKTWQHIAKEHSEIAPIIEKYEEYEKAERDLNDADSMLLEETDKDMVAMLKEERELAHEKTKQCIEELKILLLPKDENDDKNVIIEIRAGAGGEDRSPQHRHEHLAEPAEKSKE